MYCNAEIHDEMISNGETNCPFCDKLLAETEKVNKQCCDKQDIENVNGMNTCVSCGLVHGYDYVAEYINFYDCMYKIRKKSVYNRKYHIENVLNNICCENRVELTNNQRDWIYKVFVEIGTILHLVNGNRKRIISTKFIIGQLFNMLGLSYKDIYVTKSKSKLKDYKRYWKKVQSLLGDKIKI